jgi:D-3-phosphoglycerate dehydrogenase
MYKIQTFNKISPVGLDRFPKNNYEIGDNVADPDGIIVRSAKLHDMEFSDNTKAIARAGAGVNNIPVDKCSDKGIVVFNTPGANANGVKELVLAGLFLSSRKVAEGISWAKSIVGEVEDVSKTVEKEKSSFKGPEIKGKTLGVVGLGAIGVMVANAAVSLGMDVIGYDPYLSVNAAWGLSMNVKRAEDLNSLFAQSDYITLHVPQTDATKGMVNADKINLMKDGVRVLNFSRGGLVNDDDILAAMESGKVAKYVTDFPNEKLLKSDKVIGIPHLGASTPESEDNCAMMAVDQIRDFLETGNIRNSVNYPEAVLPKAEKTMRLTLIHKNVPNMVGQITTILANEKMNIDDMLNKSRGELAYSIIDVHNQKVSEGTIAKLEAIEHVLRVRVI